MDCCGALAWILFPYSLTVRAGLIGFDGKIGGITAGWEGFGFRIIGVGSIPTPPLGRGGIAGRAGSAGWLGALGMFTGATGGYTTGLSPES